MLCTIRYGKYSYQHW